MLSIHAIDAQTAEKLLKGLEKASPIVSDGSPYLVYVVDCREDLHVSTSGKTTIVATTGGNQMVGVVNGRRIKCGLTAFRPNG